MATNYPGSLDNFTNPTSASPINSPSHADQHSNANDAIEAIEGELGTNPKGAKATVKARLDDVDTAIALKAPIASPTFTGTVTIPAGSAITGVPYLATANTFTGGVQQITTASASTIGLIVKASASQSVNLIQTQDSTGASYFGVSTFGDTRIGITSSVGGKLGVSTGGTTNIGLVVRGVASQTANLQEWQASDGTVYGRFNAFGSLYVSNNTEGGTAQFGNTGFASASSVVLKVKGSASQTANLQEWQNSAGTVLAKVDASGNATLANVTLGLLVSGSDYRGSYGIGGGGLTTSHGAFAMQSWSTTIVTGVLRAAASQTADLQQWQDSAGTVLTKVNAYGRMTINSTVDAGGAALYVFQPNGGYGVRVLGAGTSGAALWVDTVAGGVGQVIRGAASQTADLQQWQNSSGTVLSKVDSLGAIYLINPNPSANSGAITSPSINFQGSIWNNAYGSQTIKGAINVTEYLGNTNPTVSKMSFLLASDNGTPAEVASFTSTGAFSNIGGLDAFGTGVIFRLRNTTDATTLAHTPSPKLELMGRAWNSSSGSAPTRAYLQVNANSINSDPFINRLGFFVATGNNAGGWIYGADATEYMSILGNGTVGINSTTPLATLDIRTTSASNKGLLIRGISGQTANLQEWQNSAGTVLTKVTSDGSVQTPGISVQYGIYSTTVGKASINPNYDTGAMGVYSEAAANKALVVRGFASQTADLTQWQDSAGTVLNSITSDGTFKFKNSVWHKSMTDGQDRFYYEPYSSSFYKSANAHYFRNSTDTTFLTINNVGNVLVNGFTASTVGLTVKGAASQTANLQEWHNSDGTVLSRITNGGGLRIESLVASSIGGAAVAGTILLVHTNQPANLGLVVKGAASQTASLQEWQNSSGTMLASITDTGFSTAILKIPYIYTYAIQGWNGVGGSIEFANATPITIKPQSASVVNLVIKGAASQSANLQEWQNSTGTVLNAINSGGYFTGGQFDSNGNLTNTLYIGAIRNLFSGNAYGSSDTDEIKLSLYGKTGQTSNFIEIKSIGGGSGKLLLSITPDGSIKGGNSSTISANTATTVDTVALSSFTTTEYTISIKQGSKVRSSKVLVHTDGTSVDSTEYGIIEMGGGITGILVTASVSSTNSILQVTITDAATTNATVKLIKTML